MGEFVYCPICKEVIGNCEHQRITMIIQILQATDKLERDNEKT